MRKINQKGKVMILGAFFIALFFIFFFNALRSETKLIPLDIIQEYDTVYNLHDTKAYNPLSSDVVLQFFPYRSMSQRSFGLTFWNPYSLGGLPFFEDIQARSLEITNLLGNLLRIPLNSFFLFSAFCLILFGALSLFAFLKELKLSTASALYGSIAYAFSSPMIIWITYTLGSAMVWLPFLLLCVEKIFKGQKKYLPFFSLAVCFQLFAGHPQASIISLIIISLYIVRSYWCYARPRKTLFIISLFLFLGITLSAIQTLPAFRFIQQSDVFRTGRATHTAGLVAEAADEFKHPGQQLMLALKRFSSSAIIAAFPNTYGNPVNRNYAYPEDAALNNYFETASYTGFLTILFAIAGIYVAAKKGSYFWTFSAIISFLIYSKIPYVSLISLLPILNKINLGRLRFIFILSFIVLAAVGINSIQQRLKTKLRNKTLVQIISALLIIALFADLYFNVAYLMGQQKTSIASLAQNEVTEYLAAHNTARFVGISPSRSGLNVPLIPNQSIINNLYDIRGYFVMQPAMFFQLATRYLSRAGNNYFEDDIFSRNFLNLYSVKYLVCKSNDCGKYEKEYPVVLQSETSKILINEQALPRAFISYNYESYTNQEDLYKRIENPATPISSSVLIPNYGSSQMNIHIPPDTATISRYDPDLISIQATAQRNGILVLTDNYYPGWKAYVDGKEERIVAAYGVLRGVFLTEGTHEVVFRYRPQFFSISIIISMVSLLLILIIYFLLNKTKYQAVKKVNGTPKRPAYSVS